VIIRDVDGLQDLARRLYTADVVVVDLETSDLNPRKGAIVGVGVAAVDGAAYIPVNHVFESTNTLLPGQLPLAQVLQELRLQDRRLVGHNVKFETKWLRHHGGIEPAFVWDTMIAARLLRSDLAADLEAVAMRELDVPGWSLPANEITNVRFLSVDRVAAYCGKDVWYALALFRKQITCLA
jgi:DNA polymerase-1